VACGANTSRGKAVEYTASCGIGGTFDLPYNVFFASPSGNGWNSCSLSLNTCIGDSCVGDSACKCK